MPASINIGRPSDKRGTCKVRYCEVTSGQTFKVGDWVMKDANGKLVIGAASGAEVDVSTDGVDLWGRAKMDAAKWLTTEGQQLFPDGCPVDCPGYDGEFVAAVCADAAGATAALDQLDVDGASAKIVLSFANVGGQWCIAEQDTGSDGAVAIVERHPRYAWGEAYGWFWCKLAPAERLEAQT